MAKKKSSFYHVRKNIVGVNEKIAAELLGVSVNEILEWDDKGSPPIAEAYLLLWDNKHVNSDGWDGFYFSRGALRYKRLIWRSEGLLQNYDFSVKNAELQRELAELRTWHGVFNLFVLVLTAGIKRFIERVKRF